MLQSAEIAAKATPCSNVHAHLQETFDRTWCNYRKSFKRCRKKFSENSVHQLRVETRRMLPLLNLVQALVGDPTVEPLRRRLKKLLRRFSPLRDTQVLVQIIDDSRCTAPATDNVRRILRRRARRLRRDLDSHLQLARLAPLKRAVSTLRKKVRRVKQTPDHAARHHRALLRAVDQAFSRVASAREHVCACDPAAIHAMRVAFKKFRYMVELLQPLLPGLTGRQLKSMHAFQSSMGKVQDNAVLLDALDQLGATRPKVSSDAATLRRDAQRRHDRSVRTFLANADRFRMFWPLRPPNNAPERLSKGGLA